jgi:hypothetical protein
VKGVEAGLPGPLADDGPFVGRSAELQRLRETWAHAAAGARQAALIGGEAGVGKTRLAGELAAIAAADGAVVLYGRSDEHLGVPYQPFIEALRERIEATTSGAEGLVRGSAVHLTRLVPGLDNQPGIERAPSVATAADAEGQRYQLFEAVVDYIDVLARDAPVVFVLDDLHWASKPTLLLLRHLLRATTPSRVLLLATYRDTDVQRGQPLAELLADTRADSGIHRLDLTGLDAAAVAELVPEPALAALVGASSNGNPFLLLELLRDLQATGRAAETDGQWRATDEVGALGVPEGVRDVLGQRLSRLTPITVRILGVASVIGPTFSIEVLRGALSGLETPDALLDALDEAVRARVVDETALPGAGYLFHHALVRDVLYEDLGAARRLRLHRLVGESIEVNGDESASEALAHHFAESAIDGQIAKAVGYGLIAARSALRSLAFEAAEVACERALAALAMDRAPDLGRRGELRVVLAEARQALGDLEGCQRDAELAAADARATGDAELLARAAILHVELTVVGSPDPVGAALCEEALEALEPQATPLRVRVAAALLYHRAWSESRGFTMATQAEEVVELARASGDDSALGDALHVKAITLAASDQLDEQLATVEELLDVADRLRHGHRREQGLQLRASARLRRGDRAGFDADAAELERLGHEHRSWNALAYAAQWHATAALLDGRFAEVPDLAAEVLVHGGRYADYQSVYASQLFLLQRELGQLDGLRPLLVGALEQTPGVVAFTTALALVHAELGDHAAALAIVDQLAPDEFAAVPRDVAWVGSLHALGEAVALLESPTHARTLYDLFLPQQGLQAVIALGLGCTGSIDRYLGMLALAEGRIDVAVAHLDDALTADARLGSPPLLARTRYWATRALLARDAPGDAQRTRTLRTDARVVADELGMTMLVRQLDAL